MKKRGIPTGAIILIVGIVIVLGVFAYIWNQPGRDVARQVEQEAQEQAQEGDGVIEEVDWREMVLTEVTTGETFKISDFSGKKILLEIFAVWCPICTAQQREIEKLHEEVGDSFVSLSIDPDLNEDAAKVRSYVAREGFGWRFAISPIDMTRSLIDEFDTGIVNAPSAPVVLICEDGSARKLPSGIKRVDQLKIEIAAGC